MPIENGKFRFNHRSTKRRGNILGLTSASSKLSGTFRRDDLEEVALYMKNRQYDTLQDWDAIGDNGEQIPMKSRKPRIIYNLAKTLVDRLSSKLLGPRVFPSFNLDEDPLTKEFNDHLINITGLKTKALSMAKSLTANGSGFLRFKIVEVDGMLHPTIEKYDSNICYPIFDAVGNLQELSIKYVFDDVEDKDENGTPKKKWYKLTLGKFSDTLYDNPEYKADSDPEFKVVSSVSHNFGFVQGEWFKTTDNMKEADGPSLVNDVKGFIDAFNYSISQSDQAVAYNQEPQLLIQGMTDDELEDLVKSSMKSWAMGRDGDAKYLESNLNGVEKASDLRDKFRENVGDITRIILMNPEKVAGYAQSAKAMEVLYAPFLDLIDEMRPFIEKGLLALQQKLIVAILITNQRGFQIAGINIPPSYSPASLSFSLLWPAVFPMTMQDLQQKVSLAVQASNGNLISRETMTKFLAKDFGVEDVEEEIQKILSQPVINPFSMF